MTSAENNNHWSHLAFDIVTVWRKDLQVWLKEPFFGFVRILIMPLLWMAIFGNVIGGSMANLPLAIVDYDNSQLSAGISSAMTEGGRISVAYSGSYGHAMELFEARKVYAVLILPKNLEGVRLMVDRSSPMVGDSISSAVSSAVTKASLPAKNGIIVEEDVHFARGASYIDFLSPGIIIQTIAFAAIFSGGLALMLERQLGTFSTLLIAPISKEAIVLGKTLAGVTQALLGGIAALAIAVLLMGVQLKTGLAGLPVILLVMLLTSFCFIGLSIALSMRISDLSGFQMVMQLVMMPLWIVSGSIYPIESMSWWLRPIASVNPLTYAAEAMRNLVLRGFSLASVSMDIAVLFLFTIVMFTLGVVSFRRSI